MKKSGLFTFCFAFVPGAGQMYQGYMKRGLSMGLLVAACFAVSFALGMDVLIFPSLIVYMYSFFDALNLRSQIYTGTAPADDFIVHLGTSKELLALVKRRNQLVGWGLVVLGVFALYQNFVSPMLWNLISMFDYSSAMYNILHSLTRGLPNLAVAIGLILAGLWLVRVGKGAAEPEEYTQFKGEQLSIAHTTTESED